MPKPEILFLSTADYVERERIGLVEALRSQDATVTCLDRFRDHAVEAVEAVTDSPPDLALHPDTYRVYLPEGIEALDCPTACLHIDTYGGWKNRARMSFLFDLALVCHPEYPEFFQKEGHPECLLFPHAVRRSFYNDPLPEKSLDLAMIGRLDGGNYSYRRSCVRAVNELEVEKNDFSNYYEYAEMAEVYRRAKIGLNVSRDDYLRDANLRCFEVMAGEALLLTPAPTELSQLGLESEEHFVTFRSENDLTEKVRYYLDHPRERQEIARNGRKETLKCFTYDRWAERLVNRIDEGIPLQAPARGMSEGEAAEIYVDYLSRRGQIDETLTHFRRQRKNRGGSLMRSLGKGVKVTVRGWQRALFS
ncbi:glycosyltransferase [Salinibacter ruber]|uniref:glycosyltransferase family protein n=1 Tax=Salinibacter ruber TaxID=146919 RepID=UPI00160A2605|nr:glycosyltransferase [Salinibacter ruber]MBB4062396.1 glycosyltransferase involved in cell wall biosynthesis [Salinibacter ruber]